MMRKTLKKVSALVLAAAMVMGMSVTGFADAKLGEGDGTTTGGGVQETGVIGGFLSTSKDTPTLDDKVLKLEKDIVAYNPESTVEYIYGPDLDYTYTVAAGTADVNITDDTTDHASGVASTTKTIAGITTGLKINGTAGTTGTIEWANTDILEVSAAGTANKKYLTIDFTDVVFSKPGVYRYTVTETEHTDAEYEAAGVVETDGTHVRYLDVYVMRSDIDDATHDIYTDGTTAAQWKVYGYVCVYNDGKDIDPTDTKKAVKTNGFVAGTKDGSAKIKADEYYTYNLKVSKDLVNDNSMINHLFPLTVAFDDDNKVTGSFQLTAETDGYKSELTTTGNAAGKTVNGSDIAANTIKKVGAAGKFDDFNNAGNPKVADGSTTTGATVGWIKYTGIPYKVKPSVTETNDNVGTTYTATVKEDVTTVDGSALVETTISSTTGTPSADDKSASISNTQTATRIGDVATANTGNKDVAIQFTNTLAVISPTGVMFRVAPYVMMLGAGFLLLLFSRRRKEA